VVKTIVVCESETLPASTPGSQSQAASEPLLTETELLGGCASAIGAPGAGGLANPLCLLYLAAQSPLDDGAEGVTGVSAAQASTALQRVPIPVPKVVIEPPNGRTLVNFETNFYTEAGPFTRTVTLLGQQVTLDIRPASYTWDFGDGEQLTTTSPGSPYPDLDVTHTYQTLGTVQPSVGITYEADYSVNGGPAQPVPGTVTIDGPTTDLTIVEARPQLVASP